LFKLYSVGYYSDVSIFIDVALSITNP